MRLITSFFTLLVSLSACAPQGQSTTATTEKPLNFANDQRLDEHWRKHGLNREEFNPPVTKEQYLKYAREFFASTAKDVEKKERDNGDKLRYRISTNEFG